MVVENRKRTNHFAETRPGALRLHAKLRRKMDRQHQMRLADVLNEYEAARLALGDCKRSSITHSLGRVRKFLAPCLDESVDALTSRRAAELYADHAARPRKAGRPLAAASHRFDLKLVRAFFRWAEKTGLAVENPFAEVVPVGRVNVGKPQLRIDEARKFSETALELFERERHPLAIGALLALWLGLRTGEVLARQVRDLDDGARVLWVERGKTRNARRRLTVPEPLREPLLRLVAGKAPQAWIFDSGSGQPFHRFSMVRYVGQICERAGVPVVCTHSLRGLHSTLALEAGATSGAVAAALGHGSFAVTAKHYAQPSAVDNAQSARVAGVLAGPERAELLRDVDEETLRELLVLLAERRKLNRS